MSLSKRALARIEQLVAEAPPLSVEQQARLASIFSSATINEDADAPAGTGAKARKDAATSYAHGNPAA